MKRLLIIFSCIFLGFVASSNGQTADKLTDQQILEIIEKHKPLKSGVSPPGLKSRLGATHVNGQYHLTDEPFIIEGAKKLQELGYGILKLWFNKADGDAHGYKYNSDWKLTKSMSLKEMAQHHYYREVFKMPFEVFVLNISYGYGRASTEDQSATLDRVEREFYELTKHFLSEYGEREVTFILSNWEGDWMMRGGTSKYSRWREDGVSADAPIRVRNMIAWIKARQKGVNRARDEFGETKTKVFNAIEVNKVYDGVLRGMPTITFDVLPHVEVDMVSWSAYDGKAPKHTRMETAVKPHREGVRMYRGIDYIRQSMVPTPYMKGEKVVFIGEINEHENVPGMSREWVQEFCDIVMGVYLAQDIPYIVYWELYANEPKDGKKSQDYSRTADELKGNWLIRPDGSHGWAQEYFDEILGQSAKSENPN